MPPKWTEIHVEDSVFIDVMKELVALATDQNHVEVTYGESGRVILAHPDLAEQWFDAVQRGPIVDDGPVDAVDVVESENVAQTTFDEAVAAAAPAETSAEEPAAEASIGNEPEVVAEPEPQANVAPATDTVVPVKRGPGRPRKTQPSVSNGEEL